MARLQRRRLVLPLLQLAVVLWLAATSGCLCRRPPTPIAGVPSPPILPDGDRTPESPPGRLYVGYGGEEILLFAGNDTTWATASTMTRLATVS
ncbi:hypothetical protein OsJ_07711 [Oryza sativa Japonica Group]|uniref:Uncharacterized protein n=1 Tax=Oryza sativa subsp. japonica TaxID=39947 RepID=B9F1C9_ORYSJ|nr:hypothetical protein OsJ_07711 [Oryza sativa Japonica Group]